MRVAFVGLVMLGCAAPPAASDPGAPALLEGEPSPPPSVRAELVAIGPTVEGPPGADARPRTRVGFRTAEGVRPVDREAMTFVPRWRSGAALVDPEGRLYEVTPGGMRRMLVAHAVGPLAVSEDEQRLAYVVLRDVSAELRVHDGARERTLAAGLASAGVLRFSADDAHVYFVGAAPGGVVGVWRASLEGTEATCLTNCALRTGTDWRSRFEPPPARPEDFLSFVPTVRYVDRDGVRREVTP